jgi:uncharacterized protein (TIGR01777 family)
MNAVFAILCVQALVGAFDNLWHHELEAKLPQRVSARYELTLHAAREAIYGVLFLALAWTRWEGAWAWALAGLLAAEIVITLADFIEEDLTRRLPALERVLHTILAVSYGAFVAALAPVLLTWASRPTAMPGAGHGWVSWLFTLYAAGVSAWSVRNWIAVARLNRVARSAPVETVVAPASGPAVLVTGATGFIGSALVRSLLEDGHRVIALTRDGRRAAPCLDRRVQVVESLDALPAETPVASIVNLAGASIVGGRWSARRKATLLASRVEVTRGLCALIERLDRRPEVLVSASAVGFYGARAPGEELDETAPPQPGAFQSDLCAAWEREACAASALGVRVVRLRFGVVLGRDGGLFPALALAARLGAAAVLGSGLQPFAWVHRADAVGLIRFAIDQPALRGAVNAVAPDAPSQAAFASAVAASVGSRARLSIPARLLKLAAGEASELLLEGQAAAPRRALAAGYRFRHPRLEAAVAELAAAASSPSAADHRPRSPVERAA